jgi:EpsI family protein
MRNGAIGVLAFLGLQFVAVNWLAGSERAPAMPDLSKFPDHFDGWMKLREDPIDVDVQKQLNADQIISRAYSGPQSNLQSNPEAGLFVAWFQSQSSGLKQPHSPQVCLPGSGWIPQVTDDVALNTSLGAIRVNRYIVSNGGFRAVVLYWYQTPRRVIEGEWAAKFWLIPDALRDRRTDTALVRIVTWGNDGDQIATENARAFGEKLYPQLREWLPR